MAQVTIRISMDENLKKQFDEICAEYGMTASAAINAFARTVVKERKIPFEISSLDGSYTKDGALKTMASLRDEARRNGTSDMSLEEINEEINAVRRGK